MSLIDEWANTPNRSTVISADEDVMSNDKKSHVIDISIRRLVLISAFRLSMIWDLLTTFLGSLIILGSANFIALGL